MNQADKEAMQSVLINMFKLAKELGNYNEPIIWELGYYLIDNLISKISIYIAKEKNEENEIYRNSIKKQTKDFPTLYKSILVKHYPSVPDYDNEVASHHNRRNIFQHSEISIERSLRKEFVQPYINLAEKIMTITGIINEDIVITPTNYLNVEKRKIKSEDFIDGEELEIPTDLNPQNERYPILINILKNWMIRYYRNPRPRINNKIYKIIKILNMFDNSSLNEYIRSGSIKPNYRVLSNVFFDCDLEIFKGRVEQEEIRPERINRTIHILAGDLALELLNYYESTQDKSHLKVATIHRTFMYKIQSENEFFTETLYFDGFFKEALELLETYRVIKLSGEDYQSDSCNTEWEIVDISKLKKFINAYSINNLLFNL